MSRTLATAALAGLLAFAFACSKADQESAKAKASEAKQKGRDGAQRFDDEARRLGRQAKREARDVRHSLNRALNMGSGGNETAAGAEEKLRQGAEHLRMAGHGARAKLDEAALVAQAKTKLAAAVGLSTVTAVEVVATGHLVTLTGTVASQQQRQRAIDAVRQVDGVTDVISHLKVQP